MKAPARIRWLRIFRRQVESGKIAIDEDKRPAVLARLTELETLPPEAMAAFARVLESFGRNFESACEMSRLVEAVFGPDNPDDRKKRDARKKHFATMFLTAGEATWKEERARFYDDEKKKRARFKSAQGGKKAATKNRAKADADWRDGAKQLIKEIEGECSRPLSASALAAKVWNKLPADKRPTEETIRKMIGKMRGRKKSLVT